MAAAATGLAAFALTGLPRTAFADALPANCTGTTTITCTFSYNGTIGTDGSSQTFTIPAGVTQVRVDAYGAQGAGTHGGLGGHAAGTIPVTSGDTLVVNVGGLDDQTARGGWNGGGGGAPSGGGASDVRSGAGSLADRLVVAGGGGGAGAFDTAMDAGGAGGGPTGGNPPNCAGALCPTGGTSTAGGSAGTGGCLGLPVVADRPPTSGTLGTGGSGEDVGCTFNPPFGSGISGGGGGGGYYGGGGGAASVEGNGNGGAILKSAPGAGGSGYVTPSAADPVNESGVQSGNGLVTINWTPTSTAVSSFLNPSNFGDPVTFTATVTGTDGTGTVAFAADGTAIPGCETVALSLVNTDYQAACTTSALHGGTHTLTATYSGSGVYQPSSGTLSGGQQVNQLGQAITFPALADRSIVESPFTLTGITGGASGTPITFTTTGACTVIGSTVKLTTPGTCAITAHQAGTTDYTAAPDVTRSFHVTSRPALRISGANIVEPDTGTRPLTFPVRLSKPVNVPVTVRWATANASARAPGDFTAASGTLTFTPGTVSRNITVLIKGDHVKEPNEIFYVLLYTPHNATIGTASAVGGILNND